MSEERDPPVGEEAPRSEGDAADDFSPSDQRERDRFGLGFTDRYTPRHRAPRASLIRRIRGKDGAIVSWETWADDEPPPATDVPASDEAARDEAGYLDTTRAELRRQRAEEVEEGEVDVAEASVVDEQTPPSSPAPEASPPAATEPADMSAPQQADAPVPSDVHPSSREDSDRPSTAGVVGALEEVAAKLAAAGLRPTETKPEEGTARPQTTEQRATQQQGSAQQASERAEHQAEQDAIDFLALSRALPGQRVDTPVPGVDGPPSPDEADPLSGEIAPPAEEAGPASHTPAPVPVQVEDPPAPVAPHIEAEGPDASPSRKPSPEGGTPLAASAAPQARVARRATISGLSETPRAVSGPPPAQPPPARRPSVSRPLPDRTILPGPSSRRDARVQRRARHRRRLTAGGVGAILVALVVSAVAGVLVKRAVDPDERPRDAAIAPAGGQGSATTTLLFGTKEGAPDRGAVWMTLLALDAATGAGSIVAVPPHTGVEVPGRGLQGVGEAYASGGIPLLLVSTENLFGIKIDRYIELSDRDARVFFDSLTPLTVDVPAAVRVPVAGKAQDARLLFDEGEQQLSASLLVRLLYTLGIGGTDLELGTRHLAFWDALLNERAAGDLSGAVQDAGAALSESDATPQQHAEFISALADLDIGDLTLTTLPVRPIGAGNAQLYAVDDEEIAAFVEETLRIARGQQDDVRVQILNGNGVPGIGQEVADKLVGEGFRLILGGNARRLNYRKTLIVTYDKSDRGIALAERARDLLGVGEVQISAQQQGIVDLTIVVGKDFLRAQ